MLGDDQQQWVMKLLGYDFEIQYKLRRDNQAANALSRQGEISTLSPIQANYTDKVMEEIANDPRLHQIVQDLIQNPMSHPGYQVRKEVLLYKVVWSYHVTFNIFPNFSKKYTPHQVAVTQISSEPLKGSLTSYIEMDKSLI